MWKISLTKKAQKQLEKLPEEVQQIFGLLFREMEVAGPYRQNWKNYGKLQGEKYHCHVKSGKPTYVVCWEITDKKSKQVEVYYVGTHEKAPY